MAGKKVIGIIPLYDDEKESISTREKLFWRLDNDK